LNDPINLDLELIYRKSPNTKLSFCNISCNVPLSIHLRDVDCYSFSMLTREIQFMFDRDTDTNTKSKEQEVIKKEQEPSSKICFFFFS
jgi:hypothetical protein